jgi:preprotein translocase subunit SecG
MIDVLSILLLAVGAVLIFVILLQRGGGLAGAFGGAGGQSAFGTKAGDVFTRITMGLAIVWVMLAVATGYAMAHQQSRYSSPAAPAVEVKS